MSASSKGQIVSKAQREAISKSLKGRKSNRASIWKDKKLSVETRLKMSESHKRRFDKTEEKAKMSKAANARWSKRKPLILTQSPLTLTQKEDTL